MFTKRKGVLREKLKNLIVLILIFSMLPINVFPFIKYNKVYASEGLTGLFTGKYGKDQIFDCFRTPTYPSAGSPFKLYNFANIYDATNGQFNSVKVDWGINGDRYVKFEDSATQGLSKYKNAYLVKLNLYEANGAFVKTISNWGTVWALDNIGFFYEGHDYYGYFISNNKGYGYGSSVTYTPSNSMITNKEDLINYSASTEVIKAPGVPTGVSAVAGDGQATVSFTAPAYNGGSPITEYIVTSYPGGITAKGSQSPIIITGLKNETAYTFTVKALNLTGISSESLNSNSVTPKKVKAMPKISVNSSNSSIIVGDTITLTALIEDGNSPSGTVTFKNGELILGTANISNNEGEYKAVYSYIPTSTDSLSITAEYGGDSNNTSVTSIPVAVMVTKKNPTLSIPAVEPPSPQTYPISSITVSTILSNYYGSLGGKTIKFYNGETFLGQSTTDSSGLAKLTLGNLGADTYNIKAKFESDVNNNTAISDSTLYTVNKGTQANLMVNGIPSAITYGDLSFFITTSGGSGTGNTLSFSTSNSNVLAVDASGKVTIKGAGTAIITVTKSGDTNYNLISKDVSITVAKKTLNVGVSPVTILCGQQIPTLTVNISGFVNGENELISGFIKPTASGSYGNTTEIVINVSIPVTYTGGNPTDNYRFSYNDKTELTIKAVNVNVGDYKTTGEYSILPNPTSWNTNDFTIIPTNGYDLISYDGVTWYSSLGVNKEALKGTVSFKLKKSSDGTQTESTDIYYNLDKTAPTGTITIKDNYFKSFLNTITFGLFFKDNVQVTITGEDSLSGIKKIEFFKSNNKLTFEQVKTLSNWTEYTKAILEEPVDRENFVYYVKLTDNAGNIQYISSEGVTFDTTLPVINGIKNGATYYVDQAFTVSDINLDTITVNGALFINGLKLIADKNATYTIIAMDKAGNSTTYTVYTKEIASIDDAIENLTTANVKSSDKAVIEVVLEALNDVLNSTNNGAAEKQINDLNAIKDNITSLLDKIQKTSEVIANVEDSIKTINEDNVKKEDRISLENAVYEFEQIIEKYNNNLTEKEKNQIEDKTAEIKDIINILEQVKEVEDQIRQLPATKDITRGDANEIYVANKAYEALTDYQVSLVDQNLKAKLKDAINALAKLLLEDPKTGTRVEGIEGTVFDINTKLVVTPIKDIFISDVTKVLKGQEIIVLYDIKLLLKGQPIQPSGKVKVTLKLTEEMKKYNNLKVVYIADDGNVTIIPSERSGDYISFETDHFSNYGIIGTAPKSGYLPKTGGGIPVIHYVAFGITLILLGLALSKPKYKAFTKK